MREIADLLVFDLRWRPADVYALNPAEIFYWCGRFVEHAKKRKRK